MWMMGCNESGGSFNMSDSLINGSSRKLRPLIPKPSSATSTTTSTTTSRNLHHNLQHHHHHHTDFYLLNNHFSAMVSEQNKRDLHLGGATTTTTVVSSRWNPTPEQLRTLEELYRRGTRTPSAEQIQHITAQLRRYGKIEGKNVFYWFQNHKARERQKRRRRSECIAEEKQHEIDPTNESADVAAGSSRTAYEVEQTKSCSHHHLTTNSTTLLTQEAVSMQEAAEAAAVVVVVGDGGGSDQSTSVKTDGWIQLEQRELQLTRRNNSTKTTTTTHDDTNHATWHMRNPSFSSSSSPPPLPNHLINTTTTTPPTDPKLMNTDHQQDDENLMMNMFIIAPMKGNQDAHTLELFPLQKAVDREDSERVINGGDHFHQHYNTGKIKNGNVHDNHHHLLMPVTTMNNNTNFMNTQYPYCRLQIDRATYSSRLYYSFGNDIALDENNNKERN